METHVRCSHKAILDYLNASGFSRAYDTLKEETQSDFTPDPRAKYAGLLEKKWTSVIRLQKKVLNVSWVLLSFLTFA